MSVENFPKTVTPTPDRNQQILTLLAELSDRLRKAESERDILKREMLACRDSIQDIDDRNSQTQKAILAFENKFDAAENTIDTAMRRLTGMEEAVDKQSTEMLVILRKIEERFEAYDREYKSHAASIESYGDTLDRFDKKLEKLMQDKARIARKLDALEFQVADTEERILNRGGSVVVRDITDDPQNIPERSTIQVWTPEAAKPQFMHGPGEIPSPTFGAATISKYAPKLWQYLSVGLLVILLAALTAGVIYALLRHPGNETPVQPQQQTPGQEKTTETTTPETATTPAPTQAANFFSPSVRSAMDQQIVAARKLEDDDTARLMAMADPAPIARQIKRNGALPRTIKAIEDKAFDGNVQAQHDMGALYSSGQSGVELDYARAAEWFRAAAYLGNANARYNLGVLYQQGLGIEKDVELALSWYRSAALLEHPEARYNLGIAYVEGIGVAYNPAMAAGYFEQAAKAGVIESAYNLGMILENGLIDEPRPLEGIFWYKLAADGGSADGTAALARLLREQKIADADLPDLFNKMLAQRPDLKALADSRKVRSIREGAGETPPRVRIHTPPEKNTSNTARKINAEVTTPPPPPKTAAPAPAKTPPKVTSTLDPQMVSRVQTMLADEGLYTGAPDGVMGPATANAIRRYQTKYGMAVDGKASTNLVAQMLARRLAVSAEPAAGENKTGTSSTENARGVND